MIHPRVAAVLALGLAAAGCASTRGASGDATAGMVTAQPSGLGITGKDTPPELAAVVEAPYALPRPLDCATLARDVAALDGVLGPDVDAPDADSEDTGQQLQSAVVGAIPYRWVLRLMTGAGRQDRDFRRAVVAGVARRSYLKGIAHARRCPAPPAPAH